MTKRASLWIQMFACAALGALGACGDNLRDPPPRTEAPSATEGVTSAALAELLVEHWNIEVALDPLSATYLGDHRADAELPPARLDEVEAVRARRRGLLARVVALDAAALDAGDRLTHAILAERLTATVGLEVCDYPRWAISQRTSPVHRLEDLGDYHPLLVSEDAASYLVRVQAMPAAVDAYAEALAAGADAGETASRSSVQGAISLFRSWAARAPTNWSIVAAVRNGYLADGERDRLIAAVTALIERELAPAYRRLVATLEARVLPVARAVDGLAGLPLGADCYAAEIRRHTTLPLTAAELHALGEAEVARIDAAMLALGQELYGVDSLGAIRARLAGDTSQQFRSEDEIIAWTEDLIARTTERVASSFASFPATPLDVVAYPASAGQVAASYWSSPDGIQPARYFLVTQPPTSQARWDLESTTYHEAIPGHHLQVGRAAELASLPLLRRAFDDTAYVEGWGLYAETLAGELELFTDGPARLGRLSNEALRACRLVIDTGLHDLGWTRAEAIAYLERHSLFAGPFVAGEIDRYISWPGQALAYKVGELELLRLRAAVRTRDGTAFSLRDFHEAVLDTGSLPLRILADKLGVPTVTQLHTRASVALQPARQPSQAGP